MEMNYLYKLHISVYHGICDQAWLTFTENNGEIARKIYLVKLTVMFFLFLFEKNCMFNLFKLLWLRFKHILKP